MKHKKLIIAIIAVVVLTAAIALTGVAFWLADGLNGTSNQYQHGHRRARHEWQHAQPQRPPALRRALALSPADGAVDYVYVGNTGSTPLMFYGYLVTVDAGGIVP